MNVITKIKNNLNLRLLLVAPLILLCTEAWASTLAWSMSSNPVERITLHFRSESALLERDYRSNFTSLQKLDELLRQPSFIQSDHSLIVVAGTSPDGSWATNDNFALLRAKAIKGYIKWKHPNLNHKMIKSNHQFSTWSDLTPMAEVDALLPHKADVLAILSRQQSHSTTEQQLRQLANGESWQHIRTHYLPDLRLGYVSIASRSVNEVAEVDEPVEEVLVTEASPEVSEEPVLVPTASKERITRLVRPIAFKTNLLFDAVGAFNVEVEVPIARRWSVAGEYTFPWILNEKKQNSLQVVAGNLEVRYWLKPNYKKQDASLGKHNPLAGWFVGLYGGGGYYDLERNHKGYQGEFFIASGLSGGYVQPLSRSLSMEFSLGLGYMKTNYRHYQAERDSNDEWRLIRQNDGTYTWIGPTKAKVSFIWYPNFKSNKKGGKR